MVVRFLELNAGNYLVNDNIRATTHGTITGDGK